MKEGACCDSGSTVFTEIPCFFEDIFLLCRLSRRELRRLLVTRASPKHLATLTLRRAAKSSVLSTVSKRLIVKTERGLIRSSDILEKSRAKHLSSDTPANARNNPHSNKLSPNEYDQRRCSIFVCCNKCARIHDTGISLLMKDCPVRKQSLSDLYNRKFPKRLRKLSRTIVTCPWTGKRSLQTDSRRIFLVPTNSR